MDEQMDGFQIGSGMEEEVTLPSKCGLPFCPLEQPPFLRVPLPPVSCDNCRLDTENSSGSLFFLYVQTLHFRGSLPLPQSRSG